MPINSANYPKNIYYIFFYHKTYKQTPKLKKCYNRKYNKMTDLNTENYTKKNRYNVLVIDDEDAMLELAEFNLRKLNLTTHGIKDPEHVTPEIMEGIDLILMDTQIGRKLGYLYCQPFKATYQLPVIGMSNNPDYRDNWFKANADGFLDKQRLFKPKLMDITICDAVLRYHFQN